MDQDLLKEYFIRFGNLPKLLQTMSYNNNFYQKLLKNALENDEPIDEKQLDIVNFDLVNQSDNIGLDQAKIKTILSVYGIKKENDTDKENDAKKRHNIFNY